jgi:hypothetical protein
MAIAKAPPYYELEAAASGAIVKPPGEGCHKGEKGVAILRERFVWFFFQRQAARYYKQFWLPRKMDKG